MGQKKIQMHGWRTSSGVAIPYHLNVVADPCTHLYREAMHAALWCWEANEACFSELQWVLPGKCGVAIFVCEFEDVMVQMALETKLERVATYRQLQGPIGI